MSLRARVAASGDRSRGPTGRALLPALVALGVAAPASAQTLVGRVLDQVTERPISGAMVSLIARDGARRAGALSDDDGRFTLAPPQAGEFFLLAEGFGYTGTRSPLLALDVEGTAPIELMLVPEPIGLEGLDVSVEELAAAELSSFGISPRQLGNRWIDHERIEAIPVKLDMGSIVERTAVAGTQVLRPANLTPGSDDIGLCISFARGRRASGQGRCALIVLDGIAIPGPQALDIDPESIESMALLEPTEATIYYGTLGSGGAVLVWTRRGG